MSPGVVAGGDVGYNKAIDFWSLLHVEAIALKQSLGLNVTQADNDYLKEHTQNYKSESIEGGAGVGIGVGPLER